MTSLNNQDSWEAEKSQGGIVRLGDDEAGMSPFPGVGKSDHLSFLQRLQPFAQLVGGKVPTLANGGGDVDLIVSKFKSFPLCTSGSISHS